MDLRRLEIFVEAARLESISRAAETLGMAQPAVSIAIGKLEAELGTALFERIGRRIRLTAEGARLQKEASKLLSQADELLASASGYRSLQKGELNLACPAMLATYFLPGLLSDFLVNHPGLRASITQAGTARIEEMLLQDQIEAGVITLQSNAAPANLELRQLLTERVVVCVAEDHPWAGRRFLNLSALHECPMVLYEPGYFIRDQFDDLCREHGVRPDMRMETNFLPLIIEMVNAGIGVSIGLQMMAAQEPGIVGIPLRPTIGLDLALAKRRDRRISIANQAFIDWLAERHTPPRPGRG